MFSCPACGARDVGDRETCSCGADLSILQCFDALTDVWFNRALKALAEGAPGKALEWLSACCVARPTDAAARRAQVKVWAQLGCWDEAQEALEIARATDPSAPELEEIQQALREAKTQSEQDRVAGKKSSTKVLSKRKKGRQAPASGKERNRKGARGRKRRSRNQGGSE